jgi:hypothetical protein
VNAAAVALWALDLRPRAGRTAVLAVEGRSGSGKTVLARAVAAGSGASLIRMDDLYPGWDGLLGGVEALRDWVLRPLAEGRAAAWRRWDWAAGEYAEWHPVPADALLVVDGAGGGARSLACYRSGLVWVDAADEQRRDRALARDGATYAPHWERWARQEDEFYAAERVREHADLIVDNGPDHAGDGPGSGGGGGLAHDVPAGDGTDQQT